MSGVTALEGIASVEDALIALQRRVQARKPRTFVICTTSRELSQAVTRALLNGDCLDKNAILLCTGKPLPARNNIRSFRLSPSSSSRTVLRAVRSLLDNVARGTVVLVDCTGVESPALQQRLFTSLAKLTASKPVVALWIVTRKGLSSETVTRLTEHADLFLNIEHLAGKTIAHFLPTRGCNDLRFLLPRMLTVTDTSLRLSSPDALFDSRATRDASDGGNASLKTRQESIEQQIHSFLASLPYPYAIFVNRKLLARNALFTSLFPWTADESPSLSHFFGRKNADFLRYVDELMQRSGESAILDTRELLIPAPGRKHVAAEVTVTVIPYLGKTALYCAFVDVSARREVQDSVARIEKKFQTLLEGSPDAISITRDGTILLVNDAFARMLGYNSPMELLGKKITTTVWGRKAREQVLEAHEHAAHDESPTSYAYQAQRPDGKIILVQAKSSRILFDGKNAVLTYHRDITEEHRQQEEFARKTTAFELLGRFIEEVQAAVSISEMYHRGMLAALRGLGFHAAGVLVAEGESLLLKHHHGLSDIVRAKLDRQSLDEPFARFFSKTHDLICCSIADYPPYLPFRALFESNGYAGVAFLPVVVDAVLHGVLFLLHRLPQTFDDDDRLFLGTLGKELGIAIQRAVLAERARSAEDRLHSTIASLNEVLYVLTPTGAFQYISPNIERLTGYKPADFSHNPNLWRTLVHPDDRPVLSQRLSHHALGKQELHLEYRVLPKGKATYIWLHDAVRYERTAEGKLVAVHGILDDITDSRRLAQIDRAGTEDASLSRVRWDILESLPDGIAVFDQNGECTEWNGTLAKLTGVAPDEAIGRSVHDLPVVREAFAQIATGLAAGETEVRVEMENLHNDPTYLLVVLGVPRRDAEGKPSGVVLTVQKRDVAVQRKLEYDLNWKSRQIALLHRILSQANAANDLPSVFKTIADELRSLIRYDGINVAFIDDDQNLTPWYAAASPSSDQSTPVEYLPLDVATIYDAVRTGQTATRSADALGNPRPQVSIPLIVDDKAIGAVTLTRYGGEPFSDDEVAFLRPVVEHIGAIIQRTTLFEQIRNDRAYVHNLLDSINQIVFTVDRNGRITHVNKAWREYIRRQGREIWADGDRILGQSLQVVMPEPAALEHYKRVMDDLFARRIEFYERDIEIREKGGQVIYHLVISPMMRHEHVSGLVFTLTDITEISRSEAEIRRRNRELVALNAIATSISKSLDLDEILRVATDQVRDSFDAAVVGFYLRAEEDSLILARSCGLRDDVARQVSRLEPASSLDTMFGPQRKPLLVVPGTEGKGPLVDAARQVSDAMGLTQCVIIPLQAKESIPGAFLIGFSHVHVFSDREQQLLLLIGNQIGAAIENAQLYGEIQHQVQTLTTLYELGKELTGLLDLNAMLQVVYRYVSKTIPLERFYYQAYSPQDNTLTLLSRTVNGVPEFYPAGVKVRSLSDWPNTIYQDVVSTGKSYMGSTSEDASDSILAVPIKSDENVVGIVSIVSPIAHLYTRAHLRLLESIANLTGVAIGKAMLYEDTLKKTAEIENRNKELDDFTYVVSHDLKEPLISIEGYSKIVMKDYHDRLDSDGKEYLTAIVQSTARMKHLIDDLLTLSRLGRMYETPETVSVRKIVDEILHDFQFSLRERHVVVNVREPLPVVRISSTRLSMVFRNLISNAMKFNDKPVPTIDIGCDEMEDEYRFWVKDNGIGIEPQYFDRIFTIFQRLKRSEEYRGTGAGLTIVKKIVEREGGRIWVESTPGSGSTFYFTIKKPA